MLLFSLYSSHFSFSSLSLSFFLCKIRSFCALNEGVGGGKKSAYGGKKNFPFLLKKNPRFSFLSQGPKCLFWTAFAQSTTFLSSHLQFLLLSPNLYLTFKYRFFFSRERKRISSSPFFSIRHIGSSFSHMHDFIDPSHRRVHGFPGRSGIHLHLSYAYHCCFLVVLGVFVLIR